MARSRRDVTIVHNPEAGDASHSVDAILTLAGDAGYRTRHVSSDGPWREALTRAPDVVAVLGGDGTVGQVATELSGWDIPLALLPAGTANNIARTLEVGGDARSLIEGWRQAPVWPLDIWEVRVGGRSERFVEALGGGFVGRLIERGDDAAEPSLILGGVLDRGRHLLKEAVAEAPAAPWLVEVDGHDHSGHYIGVEVMNIRSIGPQAMFAPDAEPGDGHLDVVLIGPDGRDELLEGLTGGTYDGGGEWPRFPTISGRTIRLLPPAGMPLHIDDGPWRSTEPHGDGALTIQQAARIGYLRT